MSCALKEIFVLAQMRSSSSHQDDELSQASGPFLQNKALGENEVNLDSRNSNSKNNKKKQKLRRLKKTALNLSEKKLVTYSQGQRAAEVGVKRQIS